MILIVCVDDNMGMAFNNRRQSRDRVLTEYINELTADSVLWMNEYSAKLYNLSDADHICVGEDFLDRAACGEYCLVEDRSVAPYEDRVEKIVLCKWNRTYPADVLFDIPLGEHLGEHLGEPVGKPLEKPVEKSLGESLEEPFKKHGWQLNSVVEFSGYSHEKITVEEWSK